MARRSRRKLLATKGPSPLGPVIGLPPEVLGEIFLHCLPPGKWGSFSEHDAPWLLTKVCHSWREVALSTPLLWSRLPMLEASGRPTVESTWGRSWGSGHLRLIELYLEKSMGAALSLAFEFSLNPDDTPFLPLITPHLSRARCLKISCPDELAKNICITHNHFPLLKSLELGCIYPSHAAAFRTSHWQGQPIAMPLEGIEFPWAQLTQLTIYVSSGAEALAVFRDCSSLEVCHLRLDRDRRHEASPALPNSMIIHPRLRALTVIDGPFSEGLLSHLVAPALSTVKFSQNNDISRERSKVILQSILLLIKNSSAKLISLILRFHIKCSPQDLVDLSASSPTITELDLDEPGEESLRYLTIKSNSPHGVLFPCLKRLVIRGPAASESTTLDMFYSRLYLAPNSNIINNTSSLHHAELYTSSFDRFMPICFGELYEKRPELNRLISHLQLVYPRTANISKENSKWAADSLRLDIQQTLPKEQELGYYEGASSTVQCFLQKLDAAFAALEMHRYTHAAEILKNKADTLMNKFSSVPETAFLHHTTYSFHTRAAKLLKRWEPLLSEYEATNKWACDDEPMGMFRMVYRRPIDA